MRMQPRSQLLRSNIKNLIYLFQQTDFGVAHADDFLYTFKVDNFMNMSSVVMDDDKMFLRK